MKLHEDGARLAGLVADGAARVLSVTVRFERGRWFAAFTVETEVSRPAAANAVVGVDLGIKTLAVLSTGEEIPSPRHLSKALRKVRRLSRTVSRRRGPDRRTRQVPSGRWRRYSDKEIFLMPVEAGDGEETGDQPAAEAPVNQASAVWTRPKSELTEQDYNDFYRHLTSDFADPIGYLHSKIEGTYEYTLLLFIPARVPYDLWLQEPHQGVRLHVRRVFIMEDTSQLMPRYLRFIRGVIDSSDLPLNVSRELLQGNRAVDSIQSNAVKKVLKLLTDLAEGEPARYATFWREFGAALKEGVAEDYANRDRTARLLRFTSTVSTAEPDVSLSGYVARMKDDQEKIYYLLAPSLATAASSPHLEAFREKGIEVLLLGDAVDN